MIIYYNEFEILFRTSNCGNVHADNNFRMIQKNYWLDSKLIPRLSDIFEFLEKIETIEFRIRNDC